MAKNKVSFTRNPSTGAVEVVKNGKKVGKVKTLADSISKSDNKTGTKRKRRG